MNPSIFKAYDVRGVYPTELNEKVVEEITRALARHFLSKVKSQKAIHSTSSGLMVRLGSPSKVKIIVGRDGRLSSPSLYKAVLRALLAIPYTLYPIPVGIITTPMLYFLVNYLKADGGIMITASHNPKEFNGIKAVGKKAKPINGTQIYELCKNLR